MSTSLLYIVFLIIPYVLSSSVFQFIAPENSYSQNVILYNGTSIDSQSSFTVIYNRAFSKIAKVGFGISGFIGTSPLTNQLYIFYLKNVSKSHFTIGLQMNGITSIILVKISYLAIQDSFGSIQIVEHIFDEFHFFGTSIIGLKQQSLTFNPMIDVLNSNWKCQSFLNGIYLRSSNGFDLQFSECSIDSHKLVTITAIVKTNCYYEKIMIMFLLIRSKYHDPQNIMLTSMYDYNYGYVEILFGNTQSLQARFNLQGIFMMGINGFYNYDSTTKLDFSWKYIKSSKYSDIDFTINVPLNAIRFHYFSLVKIVCIDSYYWSPQDQTCIEQCLISYTTNPLNRICEKCSENCQKCSKTRETCSTCFSGYQLIGQACQEQNQSIYLFFLFSLIGLIPILIVAILLLFCRRKNRVSNSAKKIKQHPSIEL